MEKIAPVTRDNSISPQNSSVSEQIAGEIPEYIGLTIDKRSFGNKILYSLYRLAKLLFGTIWIFYAPFVALLVSLALPTFSYVEEKSTTDGSSMGEEY